MFIKKDIRKIPEILSDATTRATNTPSSPNPANDNDNNDKSKGIVTEMRFSRRAPEFVPHCNVSLLLEPTYRPALDNLIQLSLYDCGLQTLSGIELTKNNRAVDEPIFPKLTSLDLGRNPKIMNNSFPDSFHTQFPNLVQLWLDDCALGPNISTTLLKMSTLEEVRMTGNQLEGELEEGIGIRYWRELKVLALDGNKLSSVGRGIGLMRELQKLSLRGNQLTALPEGVPNSKNAVLSMINLSSNKLTSLPDSIMEVVTLKEMYFNANQLTSLPEGLADKLGGLTKFNLAHNSIGKGMNGVPSSSQDYGGDEAMEDVDADGVLPEDFVTRFGLPEPLTGNCTDDNDCVVKMEGNPLAEAFKKRHLDEEQRKAKAMAMETEVIED